MLAPNLSTEHVKHCQLVEKVILENTVAIESWFRKQWLLNPPTVTSSVDLRNAGFKLAPVDTNLFPAGFNNLNRDFLPLAIQAAQAFVTELLPSCLNILIIPEDHTRNDFYFQSLYDLRDIFVKAGFLVEIGSPNIKNTLEVEVKERNATLSIKPITKKGDELVINDFKHCMVILNNDLSSGIPEIFKNIKQPISPSPELGWVNRLKSEHFKIYQDIAIEFSELINLDPWLINPLFTTAENVDFMTKQGLDEIADKADKLLGEISLKYKSLNIDEKPFIAVKADKGTYGMGVIMVHDAKEIIDLNRKDRKRMHKVKGGITVDKVLLQEGIYSFETVKNKAVAEPVVYMIGSYVIGGFYRVHKGRGKADNLNAPGMHFAPLAFSDACNMPNQELKETACPNRFYVYGVIARLAALAAAKEMKTKD